MRLLFQIVSTSFSPMSKHPPCATYGTVVSTLLSLISSAYHNLQWLNQQPQNVETELLPTGHQLMPHVSDAKLTSHGKNAPPHDPMYLESTFLPYRGYNHP